MIFQFILSHIQAGIVVATETLTSNPNGWDETAIKLIRDEKYHGLFKEYTVKLDFFCNGGGREFIEDIYDELGIDEEIEIQINVDCLHNGNFDDLYTGTLDLSGVEKDKIYLRCNIHEKGIVQLVKKREDIKIQLDKNETLDGTALAGMTYLGYDLNLHSKKIFLRGAIGEPNPITETLPAITYVTSDALNTFLQFPHELIEESLKTTSRNPITTEAITGGFPSTVNVLAFHLADDSIDYYPEVPLLNVDYNVRLKGTFHDKDATAQTRQKADGGFSFQIGFNKTSTTSILLGTLSANGTDPDGYTTSDADHTIDFDITKSGSFTLQRGQSIWEYLFFNYLVTTGGVSTDVTFEIEWEICEIELLIYSTFRATKCKAVAIHEAFARISQSVTNQTDAFRSDYLGRKNSAPNTYAANGCGSFLAVTNGYQIRGRGLTDNPIFMSLKELFNASNSIYNLGLGVETGGSGYVIRVEPKEYFYDAATVLFQLQNIPNLKEISAEQYYYNEIEIGYKDWQVEEINSLDEHNTKQQYAIAVKTLKKKIDAVSEFIAGAYAIEYTRRQTVKPTKDWRWDKNNFFITLGIGTDGSGNPADLDEAEKNERYSAVTGIYDPATTYNLRISPKRNLIRWMNVIGSSLLKKAGSELLFTYGEGNLSLASTWNNAYLVDCVGNYNNVSLVEKADIAWDNANVNNAPIWQPIIYDFEFPLSFSQFKTLRNNPNGCIEISETDIDFVKAFILEVNYNPTKGSANFKLLKSYA